MDQLIPNSNDENNNFRDILAQVQKRKVSLSCTKSWIGYSIIFGSAVCVKLSILGTYNKVHRDVTKEWSTRHDHEDTAISRKFELHLFLA